MSNKWGSVLAGALVALLVILPVQAGDNDWLKQPVQSFHVRNLEIDDVVGKLTVDVRENGPVTLQVSGVRWKVDRLAVKQAGDRLRITGHGGDHVWDWKRWFDFSKDGKKNATNLYIHLTVPKGIAVDVDGLIGHAQIGDTYGPLTFATAGRADSRIGKVADAKIALAGSGKIMVAGVGGDLRAETAGSGDIVAGDVDGSVKVEIAGSGSVTTAQIRHGVHVEIAGSGDFTAASVNGPTRIEIAGSGSVAIKSGEANPFKVDIVGSGDIDFGGVAVDPDIESMGSGNVSIKAYRGNLRTEGHVKLRTGQ